MDKISGYHLQVSNSYCYSNASLHFFSLYYYYLFVPPLHFKFRNITDKQNSYTTRLPKYIDILIGIFLIIIHTYKYTKSSYNLAIFSRIKYLIR